MRVFEVQNQGNTGEIRHGAENSVRAHTPLGVDLLEGVELLQLVGDRVVLVGVGLVVLELREQARNLDLEFARFSSLLDVRQVDLFVPSVGVSL